MIDQENIQGDNIRLKARVDELEAASRVTRRLGQILELSQLLEELADMLVDITRFRRALIFVTDEENAQLKFGTMSTALDSNEAMALVRSMPLPIYSVSRDLKIAALLDGQSLSSPADNSLAASAWQRLAHTINATLTVIVPMTLKDRLIGVIALDATDLDPDALRSSQRIVESIAPNATIALENARLHSKTVAELAAKMHELYMLRQIDRELNEIIVPNHVFDLTLDWALRFTLGHASSLALYDEDSDDLRYVAAYGYDVGVEELAELRTQQGGGIPQRVARSGRAELIPDVSMDKDHIPLQTTVQSQLCVPVMREDRVIAVIVVESRRLNAFSDEHLDFIEKLATRAGVAIDNARLFGETEREREKLSRILSNIVDAVVVVNADHRIVLINQAALAALHLYPEESYLGRSFNEVFDDTALLKVYQQAVNTGQTIVGEVQVPGERVFYANLTFTDGIGWIIVMHDITPLKETDRLKSELVATVSHDLKQPLSVMNGYSELLLMQPNFDRQSTNYVKMIQRSINNMRQLIDDLLNLARIESGVQLTLQSMDVKPILNEIIDNNRAAADLKVMTLHADFSEPLPLILGETGSLTQIFNNLVSNAIKYTPPEGRIDVWAEATGKYIRIAVKDTGLGISPEDQARIFDRFYRVRRPETDSIEGTGLGLAIVKRLVEMHNGQIGLESRLGEGSTFYVTLPIFQS
jgi:signal transduction histidine kinase